ncbi:MAG: hypothetical protein KIT83_16830 [Bryobacterales bacterium]|nr:hypothetical protein [Bryobacterales bacterium]
MSTGTRESPFEMLPPEAEFASRTETAPSVSMPQYREAILQETAGTLAY